MDDQLMPDVKSAKAIYHQELEQVVQVQEKSTK